MRIFNSDESGNQENASKQVLFGIICITVLFFILTIKKDSPLTLALCLVPEALKDFQLWRLFSSLLIQMSGWNLFFEMFALYIFGTILIPKMSASKIFSLYLFSGLAGNLFWLLFNWNAPYGICGCSGAVNGVIMASAMVAPNLQMYLLFVPFPVKLRTMAIVFMLLNIFLSGFSPYSLLDIGGFIGGYLFMRLFMKSIVEWDFLTSIKFKKTPQKTYTTYTFNPNPKPRQTASRFPDRNEVDRILDKLSRSGINSLTDEEIKVLENVREQMNRKN